MPIFEYQCEKCGTEFQDLVLSRADEAAVACKSCGSQQVTKLMSSAAVQSGGGASAVASGPTPMPRMGGCGGGCSCH